MPDGQEGRVGPNAILQTDEALKNLGGEDLAARIFAEAGLGALRATPPDRMVPQDQAARLHTTLMQHLPPEQAAQVAREAGERTGRYILANRIPKFARGLLQLLPVRIAGPMLLRAIEKHAWTFAGTGAVSSERGPPMAFTIRDNPLAVPGCVWHCAVFETLFRRLVHSRTEVHHPSCCAEGADACVYVIEIPTD